MPYAFLLLASFVAILIGVASRKQIRIDASPLQLSLIEGIATDFDGSSGGWNRGQKSGESRLNSPIPTQGRSEVN
jgi:hypothetical protein